MRHEIKPPKHSDSPLFVRTQQLGLYLIVDSSEGISRFKNTGIKTMQLRIKNKEAKNLEKEIATSIEIAAHHNIQLFINDYWEFAVKHQAFGVHLGQEDIVSADFHRIANANLQLGISTNSAEEVTRALKIQPSYIACGPIFPTATKETALPPQGIENLKHWRKTLDYPLVAIGGISLSNLDQVLDCGVEGVAVISAILNAPNPEKEIEKFLNRIGR